MKQVLFVINTEGHLLSMASLIFDQFNLENGYQPYVLQIGLSGSPRFKNQINRELLTDYYFQIDPDSRFLKKDLEIILDQSFERVFIFLEQLSINVFLVDYFKKKGSIICLAPDGNNPYLTYEKSMIPYRIRKTFLTYKYLASKKLAYKRLYFLNMNYGHTKPLDEIWVTFPGSYPNKTNKKVVGFNVLSNPACVNKTAALFNFNITNDLPVTNDIIFYLNNPGYKENTYHAEIEVINFIRKKYPEKPFYLKQHPHTPESQSEAFNNLGIQTFSNSIPAELYIGSIHNSTVISCWSAALMINNPGCRFFWLYKYLMKTGDMVDFMSLSNPTTHIQCIENLNEIKTL